ncbi:MAG TPA: MBL fold metallo-hydrolase [Myxococcota bacterium]|jgi:glyoxylase-like metal-dependent hydrolase (beta-lactamase superfamily II)
MSWKQLGLARFRFEKGLQEVGRGLYAYLQPDGSWGWSNAGLVVDGDRSLLVDTLFDLRLTREMLDAMRRAEPRAAARIGTLVNTHANGDHCYGNALVAGAEIVASTATAEEMKHLPAAVLGGLVKSLGGDDSPLGRFVRRAFGPFAFDEVGPIALPTRTFDGALALRVGDRAVELIEVGPAHTRGDVIAHVPDARTVFTGDILFVEGTPIVWEGPVANWIAACDRILALNAEVIVPGHGPITDRRGAEAVRAYLAFVTREARLRFDAGMDAPTAARDIELGEFAEWSDRERIVVNVDTLYREFGAPSGGGDTLRLLRGMGEYAAR